MVTLLLPAASTKVFLPLDPPLEAEETPVEDFQLPVLLEEALVSVAQDLERHLPFLRMRQVLLLVVPGVKDTVLQ
jgi:hypothetical protein